MISVEQMTDEEALARLCAGLSKTDVEAHRTFLASLVSRAGRCPLLMELANGRLWALGRDYDRQIWGTEVESEFSLGDITEFDRYDRPPVDLSDTNARDAAFTESIGASLVLLTHEQRRRFLELAIFPQASIPYTSVALYWGETARIDKQAAWDLLNRLRRMALVKGSLVENIEPATKVETLAPAIRLHDAVRAFARDPMQMSPHTLISLNRRFLKAHVEAGGAALAKGTALARYGGTWLPWHAAEAGEKFSAPLPR
jgi:hypothetical protein